MYRGWWSLHCIVLNVCWVLSGSGRNGTDQLVVADETSSDDVTGYIISIIIIDWRANNSMYLIYIQRLGILASD